MLTVKEKCTGCRICSEVCPKNAITMIEDEEGFLYPHINNSICINCSKCEQTCPILNVTTHSIQKAKVGIHLEPSNIRNSASGGAFFALCEELIPKGYVVFGAEWDKNLQVKHSFATTLDNCEVFRKSKYIQSDTTGCYAKIKQIIREGGKVLFTGTPCQVAACKNFMNNHPNLLLVDLICHGVPSQKVFNKELSYLEKKHHSKIIEYSFKSKHPFHGNFNCRTCRITNEKGDIFLCDKHNDPFLRGYYARLLNRPSCSHCIFAQSARVGDITLGDAWDIENIYPFLNSMKGVSLILFNTDKGLKYAESLQKRMNLYDISTKWAISKNEQLRKPSDEHPCRDVFFKNIDKEDFSHLIYRLTNRTKKEYLKWKVKIFLKDHILHYIR